MYKARDNNPFIRCNTEPCGEDVLTFSSFGSGNDSKLNFPPFFPNSHTKRWSQQDYTENFDEDECDE